MESELFEVALGTKEPWCVLEVVLDVGLRP